MTDIPKDCTANLEYRANLLNKAARNPGLQVDMNKFEARQASLKGSPLIDDRRCN